METVVITDYLEENLDLEREELSAAGLQLVGHQLKRASSSEIIDAVSDADYLAVNMIEIGADIINSLKKCKLIVRHGIGYDNVDVAAATARGIPVVNVPDYCIDEVAEQATALLFFLGRGIFGQVECFDRSLPEGVWDTSPIPVIRRLRGKTVGIVGFGRIGTRVYEILSSFGFRVLVCDPYVSSEKLSSCGTNHTPLVDMLPQCDLVTMHTLLNEETKHLIDEKAISLFKPGAYIVNTSRGPVIDGEALCAALKAGKIGGAALDVFEDGEPPNPGNELYSLPNVVTTPHYAWASEESGLDLRKKMIVAIAAVARGEEAPNIVNPEYREHNTR